MRALSDTPFVDLAIGPDDTALVLSSLARDHAVVHSSLGAHVLSYDGCEKVFLDPAFHHGARASMERAGVADDEQFTRPGRTLTGTEGAEHTALRRVVGPWFTPATVARLRDRTADLVARRLDAVGHDVDFMADVVGDLPGVVFCWMIGAPESDAPPLARISETLLLTFRGDPADGPRIIDAAVELRAMVDGLVAARRRAPGDDIISSMLPALSDGVITDEDLHMLLGELLAASTDNTAHSLGLIMSILAERPADWARLRLRSDDLAVVVDECLRFEPRVRVMPTVAANDASVEEVAIPAGTFVALNLATAHRDPLAFEQPDDLDLYQPRTKRQLNFGVGRHYCIGAALAKMEMETVLSMLLGAWTTIQPSQPPRIERDVQTSVTRLTLAVRPSR